MEYIPTREYYSDLNIEKKLTRRARALLEIMEKVRKEDEEKEYNLSGYRTQDMWRKLLKIECEYTTVLYTLLKELEKEGKIESITPKDVVLYCLENCKDDKNLSGVVRCLKNGGNCKKVLPPEVLQNLKLGGKGKRIKKLFKPKLYRIKF